MKNNPLFFDSTKFRGDNVIVEIELHGVELSIGESLQVRVVLPDGAESLIQMGASGLRKWKADARVEYQQRIKLEFLVKRDKEIVDKSDIRVAIASYSIYQKWERGPKTYETIKTVEPSDDLDHLINGPTLVENSNGVFEPLVPVTSTVPTGQNVPRNLPMIIEIKNPKATADSMEVSSEKPIFTNENFVTPTINNDLE